MSHHNKLEMSHHNKVDMSHHNKLEMSHHNKLGRKLDQNSRLFRIERVYMAELLRGSCVLVQLFQLYVSVPVSFFGRLGVLRCLDDVPLGLLQVRQQQLLGQALKEQKLVNLLQLGNLNKLGSK